MCQPQTTTFGSPCSSSVLDPGDRGRHLGQGEQAAQPGELALDAAQVAVLDRGAQLVRLGALLHLAIAWLSSSSAGSRRVTMRNGGRSRSTASRGGRCQNGAIALRKLGRAGARARDLLDRLDAAAGLDLAELEGAVGPDEGVVVGPSIRSGAKQRRADQSSLGKPFGVGVPVSRITRAQRASRPSPAQRGPYSSRVRLASGS